MAGSPSVKRQRKLGIRDEDGNLVHFPYLRPISGMIRSTVGRSSMTPLGRPSRFPGVRAGRSGIGAKRSSDVPAAISAASTTIGSEVSAATIRTVRSVSPVFRMATIDDAVKEIRRVAKIGIKGLELSCSWDVEPMWHLVWESLWNAVEDVQLPLHFHTLLTTSPRAREGVSGQVRRAAMFTGVSPRWGSSTSLPRCRAPACWSATAPYGLSFGESGIGWLALRARPDGFRV